MLKTLGDLISTLSVILLGLVCWSTAMKHPSLLACLVGGMAASIIGMVLRWLSVLHGAYMSNGILARALRIPLKRQSPVSAGVACTTW
ncbi:hypothetical protein BH10PSE1_BH10PSE1_25130 [soil metagenome]